MKKIVEGYKEFYATFRGGLGKNGFNKEVDVEVRVYTDGHSEYRHFGKSWRKLFGLDWNKGIEDLEGKDENGNLKYPFKMVEKNYGGDDVPFRVYDVSLKLEPYRENLQHTSLYIQNHQKSLENLQLKQMLSTAHAKTNIIASGDRLKKHEEENAKHQKKVRSHYTFNQDFRSEI